LDKIKTMDLVILGWSCQGLSQAGISQGLSYPRLMVILGVDSSVVLFLNLSVALMCIYVGKCPTFGGFSANCIGSIATN
jgi:hypothetical protein